MNERPRIDGWYSDNSASYVLVTRVETGDRHQSDAMKHKIFVIPKKKRDSSGSSIRYLYDTFGRWNTNRDIKAIGDAHQMSNANDFYNLFDTTDAFKFIPGKIKYPCTCCPFDDWGIPVLQALEMFISKETKPKQTMLNSTTTVISTYTDKFILEYFLSILRVLSVTLDHFYDFKGDTTASTSRHDPPKFSIDNVYIHDKKYNFNNDGKQMWRTMFVGIEHSDAGRDTKRVVADGIREIYRALNNTLESQRHVRWLPPDVVDDIVYFLQDLEMKCMASRGAEASVKLVNFAASEILESLSAYKAHPIRWGPYIKFIDKSQSHNRR